jgi:hypothetical protein
MWSFSGLNKAYKKIILTFAKIFQSYATNCINIIN